MRKPLLCFIKKREIVLTSDAVHFIGERSAEHAIERGVVTAAIHGEFDVRSNDIPFLSLGVEHVLDFMAKHEFGEREHLVLLMGPVSQPGIGVAGDHEGQVIEDPFVNLDAPCLVQKDDGAGQANTVLFIFPPGEGQVLVHTPQLQRVRSLFEFEVRHYPARHYGL